jgi:hypothetical protein
VVLGDEEGEVGKAKEEVERRLDKGWYVCGRF